MFLFACHISHVSVRWWRRLTLQSQWVWFVECEVSLRWWSTVRSNQRQLSLGNLMESWCTVLETFAITSLPGSSCRMLQSECLYCNIHVGRIPSKVQRGRHQVILNRKGSKKQFKELYLMSCVLVQESIGLVVGMETIK